ncbi:pentatricopeptide repeat-containing protein At3g57430, chloroplastic-like [Phalaenopsis equestris]|uniref:pentatricopeptide repeat-containing protein At3g57430, chloroplastic-like n=1 Tax=Phalaenopsis equestris TaxID=78828 RepID=UPI0009E36BBD|nr:pentatricopeptide repeat-containing protein At3g57430, chloroplastic-like [Phalaenopsis equestris]
MVLSSLFRAVADTKNISRGKIVHSKIIVSSLLPDVITSNHLMSMYEKFGLLDDAGLVLDRMRNPNVVSWTILINAHSKIGSAKEAIECFRLMVSRGFQPNEITYVSVTSACAKLRAVKASKEIHGRVYRFENVISNRFVSNSLVNLCSKCGFVCSARKVFDQISQPNLSWSSMISGHSQFGEHGEALRIWLRARKYFLVLNEFVLSAVLSACSGLEDLKVAKQVHCFSLKNGLLSDSFVEAGTIEMYVNSGDLESSCIAFSDIEEPELASWAAIIKGYALEGHGEKAMCFFQKLLLPDVITSNHLMSIYEKFVLLDDARLVFDRMPNRNVVSWIILINAHSKIGSAKEAIECFRLMVSSGFQPNEITYVSVTSACAKLRAVKATKEIHGRVYRFENVISNRFVSNSVLRTRPNEYVLPSILVGCSISHLVEEGLQIHSLIIKLGYQMSSFVGNTIMDFHAKCGMLRESFRVFSRMPSVNLVSWNSMVVGYAQHGFGMNALEMFDRMEEEGILPNEITYIGILSACARAGLVDRGEILFQLMKIKGIIPRIEHYACMVDLFARAGQTKRAYKFIKSMPMEANTVIWRSLLAGCKTHGDLNVGKLAAKYILKDDCHDISARALSSALYADAGLWDRRSKVRSLPKREAEKVPGRSWIKVKGRIPLLDDSVGI